MNKKPQEPSAGRPRRGFEQFKEKGNYALGWILIGCALVDGVVDPFASISAPALLGSGLALIGVDKISDIWK